MSTICLYKKPTLQLINPRGSLSLSLYVEFSTSGMQKAIRNVFNLDKQNC